MDESVMSFGQSGQLMFFLRWESNQLHSTAAERTRGALTAYVGDRLVWGLPGARESKGFLWSWIELLEHLAEYWPLLEWEQCDPLSLMEPPEYLRVSAERHWADSPQRERDRQERQLWGFEQAHDLSSGIQGAWLPELWVLREGREYVVAGQGARIRQSEGSLLETLQGLADAILDRLGNNADARAAAVSSAWKRRRQYPAHQFVSIATGLDQTILDEIVREGKSEETWELSEDLQDNELLAVARMAGPRISPKVIRTIIHRVRRISQHDVPALESVSSGVPPLSQEQLPYEQGYVLATWLRAYLGVDEKSGSVDAEKILAGWKIRVLELDLHTESIDAVSCWGPAHGPAILLNPSGKHSQGASGRRATLAHEICHLLVDRNGALPLAEVLGGRIARETEARARAFAAELLLPRHVAAEILEETKGPEAAVRGLCRKYQVSKEIVAWQARNSGETLSASVKDYLRSLVTEPGFF